VQKLLGLVETPTPRLRDPCPTSTVKKDKSNKYPIIHSKELMEILKTRINGKVLLKSLGEINTKFKAKNIYATNSKKRVLKEV